MRYALNGLKRSAPTTNRLPERFTFVTVACVAERFRKRGLYKCTVRFRLTGISGRPYDRQSLLCGSSWGGRADSVFDGDEMPAMFHVSCFMFHGLWPKTQGPRLKTHNLCSYY